MSTTVKRVLRGGSRNQSTADYSRHSLFTYGNRFQEAVFNNSTAGDLTAERGILVVRNTTSNKIQPAADDGSDIANIIGILEINEVVLGTGLDADANYCVMGDIDATELILPGSVADLNHTVGTRNLLDILTGLGFVVKNVTENSNFDN